MARRATEFAAQELTARFEALRRAADKHKGTPKEVRELIDAPVAGLGQNFPTVDMPDEEEVEVEIKPKDAVERGTKPSAQRRATKN